MGQRQGPCSCAQLDRARTLNTPLCGEAPQWQRCLLDVERCVRYLDDDRGDVVLLGHRTSKGSRRAVYALHDVVRAVIRMCPDVSDHAIAAKLRTVRIERLRSPIGAEHQTAAARTDIDALRMSHRQTGRAASPCCPRCSRFPPSHRAARRECGRRSRMSPSRTQRQCGPATS